MTPGAWASAAHLASAWHQPDPVLAVLAIWGVNQPMDDPPSLPTK